MTAENEGGNWEQFSWCVSDPMFPVGNAFRLSPSLNQSLCLDWAFDADDNAWAILSGDSCATRTPLEWRRAT